MVPVSIIEGKFDITMLYRNRRLRRTSMLVGSIVPPKTSDKTLGLFHRKFVIFNDKEIFIINYLIDLCKIFNGYGIIIIFFKALIPITYGE